MRFIFWDVDGTLVDSAVLHQDKIVTLSREMGVTVTVEDWDNTLYGKADHLCHAWMMAQNPRKPMPLPQFIEKCEAHFAAHSHTLRPRAGAMEAFNHFAAKGYHQVAVSSGTRQGINASLAAIGILDRLVFTIAEGDTEKSKPDPEPYNVAYERLAVYARASGKTPPAKSACLVIEDSKGGAQAGGASGIPTIFWQPRRIYPDSPHATHNVVGEENFIKLVRKLG